MYIRGYGIELKRLTVEDIELVRHHRNSDNIRQFMEYRNYITAEEQLNWFQKIDNINNNYFIIISDQKKVGLIYGAGIDWNKRITANGGIFIWDTDYWNSGTPGAASFLLTDTSILMGLEKTYIKVLKTNNRAISFNKQLGYILLPGQEEEFNQKYVLDIDTYQMRHAEALQKLFPKVTDINVEIIFETDSPLNRFYLEMINKTPLEIKQRFIITKRF